jgi:DNA-binding response OmpR family regulator
MKTVLLLLVEDEPLLYDFIETGLNDAGFELTIKSNGKDAVAELDADAGLYQAVITDIRLGEGPSGWDVGRYARKLIHDMPIVYMSGDSAVDWSSEGVPDSIMIEKPFVVAQLVTAITMLLNKASV